MDEEIKGQGLDLNTSIFTSLILVLSPGRSNKKVAIFYGLFWTACIEIITAVESWDHQTMTISYTGYVACWPEQMLRFFSPKGNIPQKQTCRADITSARCKNSQDHWMKHKTGQWKVGRQNWMENRWYRKKWHPNSSISVNTINSMSIWEEESGSQLCQFLLYIINV